MIPFSTYNNADAAIIRLLKKISVNINPEEIIAELEKHPDYPSMLALSDVLRFFKIENSAFRIKFEQLQMVPCPYIAHLTTNGGEFVVVNKVKENFFYISSERLNNKKITATDFGKIFEGAILAPEKPPIKTPVSIANRLAQFKSQALLLGIMALIILGLLNSGYFNRLDWSLLVLTVLKTAGLATSVLLLIQSINSNNPLIQKLCKGGGKTDCNAILDSKAANVFDGLSWSEMGFFYFAGTWVLLLFGGSASLNWQVLALLNVISLPYTAYSIYYQARVARKWCVLCCTVQGLLWLECITLIIGNTSFLHPGWNNGIWIPIVNCLLAPIILWLLLKPLLLKSQQSNILKQQLHQFKYNSKLFEKVLISQPKYVTPSEKWSIVLGKVKATNVITLVTNPYCSPCAKAHMLLDELLQNNENVQARIIFTTDNSDKDIKTPISRHFMALASLPDTTIVKRALHDWYKRKEKNYDSWAQFHGANINEVEDEILNKQRNWCLVAEVTSTPTLLLNGYKLPPIYNLSDLKYMLE